MRDLPTSQLRQGMVIHAHGARLKLVDGGLCEEHRLPDVYRWTTTFLGPVPGMTQEELRTRVPEHWLQNWIIQGNDLAKWNVEQ